MPSSELELLRRAQIVELRVGRLAAEAEFCVDAARLDAILAEITVLRDSLYEIAEEQAVMLLEDARRRAARPWWKRWLR